VEYLLAALMGVVEGLTEFLPISSTGHLILAGHFLGFDKLPGIGEDFAKVFDIVIQLGAILAVVAAYPRRFAGLLQFKENRGLSGFHGIKLLVITSIPASLLGFLTHKMIHQHLFNPLTVAAALAVGAVGILVVERLHLRTKIENVDAITWKEATVVGLFQCFALWPGMSRSASTIVGGMISGVDRKAATEYSFFAAVPIMFAATLYEAFKNRALFDTAHFGVLAVGFIVSFIFGWIAVKFLVHFLSHHTLSPFGWYRLVVAGAIFGMAIYGVQLMN
jgi:undecaprenyl-diphosphatase